MTNLTQLTATELRRRIGAKEISPVELMVACLAQIEQHNPTINAMCTLSETAMEEAREAENAVMRGEPLGLLHGLPVGIKDVTDTAGLRTTYGSPLYADHVPEEDALVVMRLKAEGAIVIGKTNVPEFALGANTYNAIFGATRNPWHTALSAGGSTGGGAAALATGMITLAEGSDLGGSLRIPASFCGVVGLRPSVGLVPTYPSADLWGTLNVTGPMARTAEDVALMLQAIAGPSPLSPLAQPFEGRDFVGAVTGRLPRGLNIAYCGDIAAIGVDNEIAQICRQAVQGLTQIEANITEIALNLAFAWQAFLDLRGAHVLATHYHHLDKLAQLGPNAVSNIKSGLQVTPQALGAAQQTRARLWTMFYELFQEFDYILTPCMAIPPFPVEQNYPETINGKPMKSYIDWIAPTFLLTLTGLPVACVPCGLTAQGLPVGLQIVGPSQGEEMVLALAQAIQKAYPIKLGIRN